MDNQVDFEKRLRQVSNRSKKRQINVIIRKHKYELQVYEQTTLSQIVKRYKQNGYFSQTSTIALYLDNKQQQQAALENTIKVILNKDDKKTIDILLMDENDKKKYKNKRGEEAPVSEVLIPFVQQKSSIALHEFKEIIDMVESRKQCDKKYNQFYMILADRLNNYMSLTKINNVMSQFLKDFINVNEIIRMIGSGEVFESLHNKVKDITLRIMSIQNNNLTFSNVLRELNELSNDNKSWIKNRKMEVDKKYGWNEREILENIKKIVKELQNDKIKLKQNENKINKLKEQLDQKSNYYTLDHSHFQKSNYKESQHVQWGTKILKVSTNFLNKNHVREEIDYAFNAIQQHQKRYICQLEALLSIRSNNIKMDLIATLLDTLSFVGQNDRVMLIIGITDKRSLMVYSRGLCRDVIKEIKSQNFCTRLDEKKQLCSQAGCPGFVLQTKIRKKFVSTDDFPLIHYDNNFLKITNCFRLVLSLKNKLLLQLRENKYGELKDEKNQLKSIFGEKVKEVEVRELELFSVKLNEDKILTDHFYICEGENKNGFSSINSTNCTFNDISIHQKERC